MDRNSRAVSAWPGCVCMFFFSPQHHSDPAGFTHHSPCNEAEETLFFMLHIRDYRWPQTSSLQTEQLVAPEGVRVSAD